MDETGDLWFSQCEGDVKYQVMLKPESRKEAAEHFLSFDDCLSDYFLFFLPFRF